MNKKTILSIFIFIFLSSFAYADITSDCSNVSALYHFDNNAFDDSGNGNNGTINGVTYSSSGRFNGAYSFDGNDDYISVPYTQDFNFTGKNEFSISAWVRVTSDITGNIITQYDWSSRRSWALEYVQWQGKVFRFTIYHDGGSSLFTSSQVPGITLNTWYHVVGVWDGTQTKVYIDYVSSDTDSAQNPNIFDSSTPIYIGSSSNSQNDFYGVIDEVAIYDKALSSSEVNQLYSAGTPIGCGSPSFDCNDTIDNDGDGLIDFGSDPGCSSLTDNSELGSNECDDGIDNDGDGGIDLADSGCSAASGTDETDCGDGACEGGENCGGNNIYPICNFDCGSCPTCGDTFCDIGETCLSDNCCNGNIITGDCCSTSDCTSPQICSDNVCSDPMPSGQVYNCSNPHPDWLFCDDFERANLQDNAGGYPWCYNWGDMVSPGSCTSTHWPSPCPGSKDGCAKISTIQSYSGSRSMQINCQPHDSCDQGRAHLTWVELGHAQQDEIFVRSMIMIGEEGDPSSWDWTNVREPMHTITTFAGIYSWLPLQNDLMQYFDYDNAHGSVEYGQPVYFVLTGTMNSGVEVPIGTNRYQAYIRIPSNVYTPPKISPGVWREVQYSAKMNTLTGGVPDNNGRVRLWIDGVLVMDYNGINLRVPPYDTIQWNKILVSLNHGGGTPPNEPPMQAQNGYWDDLIISSSYINMTESAVSDTTPPTTTANPLGGTYTSSQSVTLTRNEAGTTYYTTDGSTPTTSSQTYSSPIPIAQNTTLKFFSVDTLGNQESVKIEIYTISPSQGSAFVWVADAMEKIQPYDAPGPATSIQLSAASNEYAPVQIVISGENTNINSMSISATDLTGPGGTISSNNLEFFKEHYMYISDASDRQSIGAFGGAPVFVPDALVPINKNVPPTYDPGNPTNIVLGLDTVYNKVFWVDLFIPKNTPAGIYSGTITVSISGNDYNVPISVQVWDFEIPSQSSLKVAMRFRPDYASVGHGLGWSDQNGFTQSYSQMAMDHRIYFWRSHENSWLNHIYSNGGTPYDGTPNSLRDDTVTIDWTEFDNKVGLMLDGNLNPEGTFFNAYALYSPASITGNAQLRLVNTPLSKEKEMELVLYWREMADHFRQKGWDDQLMFYNTDEPTIAMYPNTLYFSRLIFYADPDVPVMVTEQYESALNVNITIDPNDPMFNPAPGFYSKRLNPSYNSNDPEYDPANPETSKYVKPAIDIWTPLNQKYDYDPSTGQFKNDQFIYDNMQSKGRSIWWYLSCKSWDCSANPSASSDLDIGSYAIDTESIYLRHVFWFTRFFNIKGFLVWATVAQFSDTGKDVWIDQTMSSGGNGDGNLFYPGRPTLTGTYPAQKAVIGGSTHIPIASIRMKIIREALEDYEYFTLLDKMGQSAYVDTQLSGLFTNTQIWDKDYTNYYSKRDIFANKIMTSHHSADINPTDACVDDTELVSYITLWKSKNSPVTISNLMNAIYIYKNLC